jgi:hypothetical protein
LHHVRRSNIPFEKDCSAGPRAVKREQNWIPARAFATIRFVAGPGIVKARRAPLVVARKMLVVRRSPARWREWFDEADIVSEGSARQESDGRVWYGSTSLVLPVGSFAASVDGGQHGVQTVEKDAVALMARLAEKDVHLRVRALRIARREAALRAPSRLGRVVCEIRVLCEDRGVRIDVDVQAPLIDEGTIAQRAR